MEGYGAVCVLGLGRAGRAAALYLAGLLENGRVSSLDVYAGLDAAADDDTRSLEALGARVIFGTEEIAGRYDLAIASPGIPPHSAFFRSALSCCTEVIGEPELAWRESPERWIAVTGTNGKTTTTALVGHLLRAGGRAVRLVGNIGNSVSAEIAARPAESWFAAELSSFQLAETRLLHPRAACLLNITPDHIDWHGSFEEYAAAKERIFANMGAGDLAVVSREDEWCRAVIERLGTRNVRTCVLDVHTEPDGSCAAFVRDGRLIVRLDGTEHALLAIGELPICGEHNIQNALAASALALEVGVAAEDICTGLAAFTALEHRIEPCGEAGGVRFVNDSKATNTDSVEKALTAFPRGRIIVLLGGHDKGTELGSMASVVAQACKLAVCFGEAGPRIASALRATVAAGEGPFEIVEEPHMKEALLAAVERAEAGDTVLLSPACSSFDEFDDYVQRGRIFKQLVAELIEKGGV